MKLLGLFFSILLVVVCSNEQKKDNVFYQNWSDSPKEGSFKMHDWIIWGGSVIKAEDGNYYMFASRWPKNLSMGAWVTNSEIVLAVSGTPEGPYKFKQVVLPNHFHDIVQIHHLDILRLYGNLR